jgi:hypothetical protein
MRTKIVHLPLLLLLACFLPGFCFSQQKEVLVSVDSANTVTKTIDTTSGKVKKINVYSPRKAAIRSAILPGWGQAYNRRYWKIPIVYAALGITGYIFVDNISTYREYRFAYAARIKAAIPNATAADSVDYYKLTPAFQTKYQPESIRAARDRFRQYIDYSVLFFVVFWGLNVIDATVDAHLKGFDISPDLSLRIKPGHSEMAGTNGLSLVLNIGKKNLPLRPLPRL